MLKLRNVERSFKTKAGLTYVLRQISLDIAEGEFVTIMGPSGAGKSTLLSILGMYDHAWEGEFFFSEFAIHRIPAKERALVNKKFVGFVFQQFHLLDDLTVASILSARRTCFRTNFPADNSNSSQSHGQLLQSQSCFWLTSPLGIFTRTRPAKLWSCSKS